MKTAILIPARFDSTRFPGKVLKKIHGKEILKHVVDRVSPVVGEENIKVLTDSKIVFDRVSEWSGVGVMMTSPECVSGTERIVSVLSKIEAENIINVQADEPLVSPELVSGIIDALTENHYEIVTPVSGCDDEEDINNPNVVKVVRDVNNFALYFSRYPIPFDRNPVGSQITDTCKYLKHIGVYGFKRSVLERYKDLPFSMLEEKEKLEQLRFLEAGYRIYTVDTDYHAIGVDTPEDLVKVRDYFDQELKENAS